MTPMATTEEAGTGEFFVWPRLAPSWGEDELHREVGIGAVGDTIPVNVEDGPDRICFRKARALFRNEMVLANKEGFSDLRDQIVRLFRRQ